MTKLKVLRALATIGGVALPFGETVRRSAHLSQWWLWIDDYLIGLALLAAAWVSRMGSERGVRSLAAAWGIASGMGYYSFVGHLERVRDLDVSGAPGVMVTSAVGLLWLISLISLAATLSLKR